MKYMPHGCKVSFISELGQQDFHWIEFQVKNWNKDLAAGFGKTKVVSIMKKLVAEGYIHSVGNGRGMKYTG